MGIESKPDKTAAHKGLDNMSYTTLDQIYPKSIPIQVGSYKAYIGGVSGCWTAFKDSSSYRINDSELFAFFRKTDSNHDKDSTWKIHLSIHPNDLNRAWDLVYPILMEHGVPCFKTTRNTVSQVMYTAMSKADTNSGSLTLAEKEQALRDIIRVANGMQITIYIPEGKEREYNNLLDQIEPILYQAGIHPGVIDKSDRALGIYSSVRNEGVKYTSHDKVSGYKAAELKDPFHALRVEWNEVKISWGGLDYARHVRKAQGLVWQMVDAEKKYKSGMQTKGEYLQIYDVAMEYFKRWHKLLKKAAPEDLAKLAARDLAEFQELKEWINQGYDFLPSIKKHNAKKVKEAEDVLEKSPRVNTLSIKPVHLLKRAKAKLDLNEGIVKPQVTAVVPTEAPLVKKESSAKVLQELKAFRKESFKDPVLDRQLEEIINKSTVSNSSKSLRRVFWGMFDGLLIGAVLGALLSLACPPWALVLCLSLSLGGMTVGGVVGNYSEPSQNAEKQSLTQKKQVMAKEEQATAPHKSSKSLGFFDNNDAGDDYEHSIGSQPINTALVV